MSIRAVLLAVLFFAAGVHARVLTDHTGRRVTLGDQPRRIVSLAPSLTETLFALEVGESVVGVTDYCDYPEEARTRPKVGGIINPSAEAIVALQPDLVLIARETNRRETLEALERLHIPVFVVNSERLDDVYRMIRDVAAAAGVPARGEELSRRLDARAAAVEKAIRGYPPRRVFLLVGLQPIVTAGQGSFLDDLLRRAGGESVAAASRQPWPRFSVEELVRADPEILLVPRTPWFSPSREELLRLPGWSELKAVQEERIVYLPAAVERPGPRLVEMLELIARALHPQAFARR